MAHNEAPEKRLILPDGMYLNGLTSNGTENISITNVAPTGVGTATISAWLKLVNQAGVEYYIPMWT